MSPLNPWPPRRGTVAVGELLLDVTDVYLDRGLVMVVATGAGTFPAGQHDSYRVYGRDGQLVYDAHDIVGLVWGDVVSGRLMLTLPLAVTDGLATGMSR